MTISLHTWTLADNPTLMALCNAVDRTFLSDRLPNPYTEADADWWLGMVAGNEGKEGVWRSILVDGQLVGSISVLEKNGFRLEETMTESVVKGGKAMELDQKTYLKAVIQADFSTKKKFALTHYKCQGGVVTKTEIPLPLALSSVDLKEGTDSLVLEVMMQQLRDSVKLAFAIDGKPRSLMIPRNYKIPFPDSDQQTYILMETYLDTPVSIEDEIPLVAITSGICKIIQMGDLRMFGQEFCDLRDKHIHPKDWCTIEGVGNYSFYTISFQ